MARIEAALSLGRLRLKKHLGSLRSIAVELDPKTQRGPLLAVGYALARLGDEMGPKLLDQHLVVPEKTLRWDILRPGVYAAGKLRMKPLRKRVELLSKRADPYTRREAVIALKRMRDQRAIPVIMERLKDRVPGVRREALTALRSLTGYKYKESYSEWQQWWLERNKTTATDGSAE